MSKEVSKEMFSDDYVLSCAKYILNIHDGTAAHTALIAISNSLHSVEIEQTPMTYTECCERIKTLVDHYEREELKE